MKTLHTAYRVTDPDVSLAFYTELGYRVVGRYRIELVQWPDGHASGITEADFA